jgi:hypothetical protein
LKHSQDLRDLPPERDFVSIEAIEDAIIAMRGAQVAQR